jgi:ribosomal protein L12E/L44/L45/RPP1/RPP2
VLYVVLRPPEYLEDARERALEVAELEHRVAQFGERRSREEVDRLMAEEGEGGEAALEAAVRRAGALTDADRAALEARMAEIESRLRRIDETLTALQGRAQAAPPAPAAEPDGDRPSRERERTRMAEELELSRAERRAKLGLPPLDSDTAREDEADDRPAIFDGAAPENGETGRAQRPVRSRRRRLSDPDPGSPYE